MGEGGPGLEARDIGHSARNYPVPGAQSIHMPILNAHGLRIQA